MLLSHSFTLMVLTTTVLKFDCLAKGNKLNLTIVTLYKIKKSYICNFPHLEFRQFVYQLAASILSVWTKKAIDTMPPKVLAKNTFY